MKKVLRSVIVNIFALWLTSKLVVGFGYEGGVQALLVAALVFGLINLLIRPLIKLLLLPINLLTLGFLGWLVNVLMLYLLTILVSQIKLEGFDFPGFSYRGFTVPGMVISRFYSAVLTSFIINFISGFLNWLAS